MENQRVAGNHLLAELDIVDFHEICGVALGVGHGAEDKHAACLCHGLDVEHAGHNGLLGEVSLEVGLVGGDVFDTDDVLLTHVYDLVDQQEGVAVGEQLADAVVVHQRRDVGVVNRRDHVHAFDVAAQQLGQLGVDGVAGACGYDAALEGSAYQGDVADDVKQLVACRLVVGLEGLLVDETELADMLVGHVHQVADMVKMLLAEGRVVDDDGVVKVAALDEVGLEQGLDLTHKYKRAAGGYLLVEVGDMVQGGVLVAQDG